MRPRPATHLRLSRSVLLVGLLVGGGCSSDPLADEPQALDELATSGVCDLDPRYLLATGVVQDGIPALTDPATLPGNDASLDRFLDGSDRVVGIEVGDIAYAVPHNVLWYHEIVNTTLDGPDGALDFAVTYCPLTGSALVFDRAQAGGAAFGVSGLLYKSNLIMYDRSSESSLWPQMLGAATCGPARGIALEAVPFIEMTWDGWRSLHPETRVVIGTGVNGPYDNYPYGEYESDPAYDFPMPPLDSRLEPKERVLGVKHSDGTAIAFPFSTLRARGAWMAVPFSTGVGGAPGVLLWDRERASAQAYVSTVGGAAAHVVADEDGFTDVETGSRWSVEGEAFSGPLTGTRLQPVESSFVAFWGAWHAFNPDTDIWGPSKPKGNDTP